MKSDLWYESLGAGMIHACRWTPEGKPRAVLQIVHGIADHISRYEEFAAFLNRQGILVVGEDHMGHGSSIAGGSIQGYFHGGWFTAVEDTCNLLRSTREEFQEVPYILFGHSMGSFMARTILCKYPDIGLSGAVICGTGWQPAFAMPAIIKAVELVGKREGETVPSEVLQKLIFGGYNARVEHPRTENDWLSRDSKQVDAYNADPFCGFTPSAGLIGAMMKGIRYIEQPENLAKMKKDLPVRFIAGGDDPVGSYGKGVRRCAEEFRKAGMKDVSLKIYPLGRHEILNEINRAEVFGDVLSWIREKILEGERVCV